MSITVYPLGNGSLAAERNALPSRISVDMVVARLIRSRASSVSISSLFRRSYLPMWMSSPQAYGGPAIVKCHGTRGSRIGGGKGCISNGSERISLRHATHFEALRPRINRDTGVYFSFR